MSTFSTARAALASQLTANTTYSIFAYPQPIPQALSVQLVPDDPYIVSTNQKYSLTATMRLRVEMFTPIWDNQGNLEQLETMAAKVRDLINDQTQNIGDLSAPRVVSLETGDLLTAYFPVQVLVNWSA
jgi:hypothetical protein